MHAHTCNKRFVVLVKVMKKNKRERDEDSVRHGDQYDTQLLWFLMRHMRNRRPARVSSPNTAINLGHINHVLGCGVQKMWALNRQAGPHQNILLVALWEM